MHGRIIKIAGKPGMNNADDKNKEQAIGEIRINPIGFGSEEYVGEEDEKANDIKDKGMIDTGDIVNKFIGDDDTAVAEGGKNGKHDTTGGIDAKIIGAGKID